MKILVVFFYSFESLTWIFSGTWIENLGCINSEKLGRPALDIFQTNEQITVSLSPRKTLFWIKITKSLFFASVHYFRLAEIELKKWSLHMLHYSFICARIISRQVPDECCVKNYEPSTRCFGGFIMYQSSLSSYILIGFFDPWPVAAEFESIALLSCDHFLISFQDLACAFWRQYSQKQYDKLAFICVSVCVNILRFVGDDRESWQLHTLDVNER